MRQHRRVVTRFAVGEEVWVPSTYLTDEDNFALATRTVRGHSGRSVVVDDRDGDTVTVSTRRVHHKTLGFLLLKVGDLVTETTLLDPLAKSVLQYIRLLVPDDAVRILEARTVPEMTEYLKTNADAISHVILVGHGTPSALRVVGDSDLGGEGFADLFKGSSPKTVISLACATGRADFAKPLSARAECKQFVAPFSEVHGAAASLYAQRLLHAHLLEGHEFRTAARLADESIERTRFRHWVDGKLQQEARRRRAAAPS